MVDMIFFKKVFIRLAVCIAKNNKKKQEILTGITYVGNKHYVVDN